MQGAKLGSCVKLAMVLDVSKSILNGPCFVTIICCNQFLGQGVVTVTDPTVWLDSAEIHPLEMLDAKNSKSRCLWGGFLGSSERGPVLALAPVFQ